MGSEFIYAGNSTGIEHSPSFSAARPSRPSKERYFMALAVAAATRSEDPYYQVGAIAATEDGRVIATAYNGLAPGISLPKSWWDDKEGRKPFVIHAETNLCSLFKRGEANTVAITLEPCPSCMLALIAHGIEHVYFSQSHEASAKSRELAQFYDVEYIQLKLHE
jgi:dCMP deaminase